MTKKKRNRARPAGSFEDRLQKLAKNARIAARTMPQGREREAFDEESQQSETVMEVSEWLVPSPQERTRMGIQREELR